MRALIDNLWAGWRMNFLQQPDDMKLLDADCVLCGLASGIGEEFDRENYILFRGESTYVVLNAFPYAAGHLLVVPDVHEGEFINLSAQTTNEVVALIKVSIAALKDAYSPEGFNVGANLGRAGGAAFGDHVHFHVVPRWLGDTNFMTTLSHARVIPEALPASYDRLLPAFRS